MTWPVLRPFSRNPLNRTSDRIQAAIVTLALSVVVVAAPFAWGAGTKIRDAETHKYLQQAQARHALVARAIDDSKPSDSFGATPITVKARWQLNGTDHTQVLGWDYAVKAGDPLQIWVDANGNQVESPTPIERAAVEGVIAAFVGWWIVVLAAAQVVSALRAHLIRMRDAQWEREIRYLVDDDGGRTNRSQ